ncbi:germinal center-associated signaling and motility protein isoform X4 [Felis catus]|uniref:germinal center-associated signaling and motility protein isoform X4 n=1 Tax=Felis catus TaxID=9685 RepID=UPI001D1A29EB|nr:germinal center-associated signaling and motility protein isoform X4 [Felis catus]
MGNSLLRKNRKKTHGFEAKPESDKENTEMSSAPIQDNADQSSLEDLSYTLINHSVLGRRSSGISGAYYENISPNTKRPREFLRRTETSYALLHVPSSPRHLPSPEDEYELLTPALTRLWMEQESTQSPRLKEKRQNVNLILRRHKHV